MKAYVLIHVRPGNIPEVVRNLRRLENVKEAHMTFGPYDIVATIQVNDIVHLGEQIATQIQPIPGIMDTMTCLVADS